MSNHKKYGYSYGYSYGYGYGYGYRYGYGYGYNNDEGKQPGLISRIVGFFRKKK